MHSPSFPPVLIDQSRTATSHPSISILCESEKHVWLNAVLEKVTTGDDHHKVIFNLVRRKSGLPSAVIKNESTKATFTISKRCSPNVVFNSEVLAHIESRHTNSVEVTQDRLAISISVVAEILISYSDAGEHAFATLVFSTYGGGYYVQRSAELTFCDVTLD